MVRTKERTPTQEGVFVAEHNPQVRHLADKLHPPEIEAKSPVTRLPHVQNKRRGQEVR
jgi:hypothetical protein